jgi:hypothetical protein
VEIPIWADEHRRIHTPPDCSQKVLPECIVHTPMGTKRKSSVVVSASLQRLSGYAFTQDCVMVFPTQINSHPIYKIVSQS